MPQSSSAAPPHFPPGCRPDAAFVAFTRAGSASAIGDILAIIKHFRLGGEWALQLPGLHLSCAPTCMWH